MVPREAQVSVLESVAALGVLAPDKCLRDSLLVSRPGDYIVYLNRVPLGMVLSQSAFRSAKVCAL